MRLLGVIASAQAGRTTGTGVVCRRGSRPTLSLPDPGRVGGSRRGVGGGREVLPEEIPHGVPDPEVIFKTQGREEGGVGTRPPTALPSPLGPGFGGQLISVISVIQQKFFGDLHQKYRKSLPRGHTRRPTLPIGGADPPIHHLPPPGHQTSKKKPWPEHRWPVGGMVPRKRDKLLVPRVVWGHRRRPGTTGPGRTPKRKMEQVSSPLPETQTRERVRQKPQPSFFRLQPATVGSGGELQRPRFGEGGGGARQYPLRVARRDEVVPESMVASPSTAQG